MIELRHPGPALLLLLVLQLVTRAEPPANLDLPVSTTAEIRSFGPGDPAPLRVRPFVEERQDRFEFEGEVLELEVLCRRLRIELSRRGEGRGPSRTPLVIRADRGLEYRVLHRLLMESRRPEIGLREIWIETEPPPGMAEGASALLPIFLIDRSLDWRTFDRGAPPFAAGEAKAALERATAAIVAVEPFSMTVAGKAVDAAGLAARLVEARRDAPASFVRLGMISSRATLGRLVRLVDVLRAAGYRTGGSGGVSELQLTRPMGAISRRRLAELPAAWIGFSDEPPFQYPYPALSLELDLMLRWLADHQAPDGRWDADGFMETDDPDFANASDGPGASDQDLGVTSLALLAFLAHGNSHKAGSFKTTVKKGLLWLRDHQDEDGRFESPAAGDDLRRQALATLTINEAFALTASPLFKPCAERATERLRLALDADGGLAATRPGEASEIEATLWALLALRSRQDMVATTEDWPRIKRARERLIILAAPPEHRLVAALEVGYRRGMNADVDQLLAATIAPADEGPTPTRITRLLRALARRFGGDRTMSSTLGESWRERLSLQDTVGNLAGSFAPSLADAAELGRVGATALIALELMADRGYGRIFTARHESAR
ncbi:MAG: terpene cyclase/mutase family protein [Planctomycetes bacterium]|nr:terpene cyclase/mutase family protein [Planctomycetota bacterium]